MAELKTKKTDASVTKFLDSIADEKKRADAYTLLDMMQKASKQEPKMWGSSIIGFGDYHYVSPATGREGDWFQIGFSPRKANLTLYAMGGSWEKQAAIQDLGKYTLGVGCLYIKKLDDVKLPVLKKMITQSVKDAKKQANEDAKRANANDFDFVPGAPARNALAHAGYTRLKQLTKITEADLVKLHGMGPKAVAAIKAEMKARGLKFKPAEKRK